MNLTGLPPYQKQGKQRKDNRPTAAQRARWERIRALSCIVCGQTASIHHCHTGMGGRKDHDKVIGLCHFHHQGEEGIHQGRAAWQEEFGTEDKLMEQTARLLGELSPHPSGPDAA